MAVNILVKLYVHDLVQKAVSLGSESITFETLSKDPYDVMIHFKRLDHFLISVPEGEIENAQRFYTEVLGLRQIHGNHPKGARWFQMGDIELHIREEANQNMSDRHPAFEIENLEGAKQYLQREGVQLSYSSDIDGRQRLFIRDPFGNRMEFLEYKV